MPAHCCCFGCKSRQEKGCQLKFFRIPKEENLRQKWISAIRRENWTPTDHSRICSKHFIKGVPSRDVNDPDYVPSIFSFTPLPKKDSQILMAKVERHQRVVKRTENVNRTAAVSALLQLSVMYEDVVPGTSTQTDNKETCDVGTQTDIDKVMFHNILYTNNRLKDLLESSKLQIAKLELDAVKAKDNLLKFKEEFDVLHCKLLALKAENEILQEAFQKRVLSYETIGKSDAKMKFYTGLPNSATFNVVFESAKSEAKRKKPRLAQEDELLITLIRLRRNLSVADLAHRFGTSTPQITRIFHRWLDALYRSLGGLIMWPESSSMQLPEVFQNHLFRKVRCIIDCSEIFIERPNVLKARAQTYSNYKRHNTVKFLVGVSPTGGIVFLSKCCGGRVSDRQITIESGFIDKLLPGDVVLADRGFTMNDEFAFKGAKLIVPAFTKGKNQLSAKEVEQSRLMSRARIHVERVIGRMKDFEVLKGTLSTLMVKRPADTTVSTIDKMVHVIGAIVNLNGPLL